MATTQVAVNGARRRVHGRRGYGEAGARGTQAAAWQLQSVQSRGQGHAGSCAAVAISAGRGQGRTSTMRRTGGRHSVASAALLRAMREKVRGRRATSSRSRQCCRLATSALPHGQTLGQRGWGCGVLVRCGGGGVLES
jgi:hypothetical protein